MTTYTKYFRTAGDTLAPLGVQLQARNSSGDYAPVDLSALTVKFKMVDEDGTTVVAETTSGVTIADTTAGKVYFDFSETHVDTAGVHYGWFMTYASTERNTYPADGRKLQINIVEAE